MSTALKTPHTPDPTLPVAETPAVTDHLLNQRQHELDALFASLAPLSEREIDGQWRGTLMAIAGVQRLPRPLARGIYRLLATPLVPWAGKSFDGETGANRWFSKRGPAFLRFDIKTIASVVDGEPVVLLDYDVPSNPRPARMIRGEVRRLGSGALLARMNLATRRGYVRVLYFTLTDSR